MPKFFLNKSYGQVPNFMGVELHQSQTFEEWHTKGHVQPLRVRDMTKVNDHRYRQTRFISQCSRSLHRLYGNVFVSTLDSDEYLVVNPWIVAETQIQKQHNSNHRHYSWETLEAGSVFRWLLDSKNASTGSSPCIQVPRLLFGSIEENNDTVPMLIQSDKNTRLAPIPRPQSQLSTLRWKFHAAYNDTRNFQQKVILDMTRFPPSDELWGDHVNSVHRPSRKMCPNETDQGHFWETALVANHPFGSWEQYFSRKDLRRNKVHYLGTSTFGSHSFTQDHSTGFPLQ
jgi:hypothetical protein